MNDLQRAFCYISRKRLKSFLLFLIFTAVNCMVLGVMGIQRASEEVMKNLRSNTESKVILEVRQGAERFTKGDVLEFSQMTNVGWMNCLWSEQLEVSGLVPVMGDEQSADVFTAHLQNRIEKDSPFEEKIYRLVEGAFPMTGNEIVINQILAEQNGLRVGDSVSGNYRVAGIFLSGTERQQTEKVATENRIENQIYIRTDETQSESSKGFTKVVCYVTEPEKLDELAGVFEEKCGGKAYVSANDATFRKMRISIGQTGRITLFILSVTLITGCLVTGLLLSMWMRGRKAEIAVYVSLGIEKRNLLLQAAVEGWMLYIISFGISEVISGNLLPKTFGSLRMSVIADGSWEMDYVGNLPVLGCGMCMILLLTVIAIFPYLKKHPKEILSEMEG